MVKTIQAKKKIEYSLVDSFEPKSDKEYYGKISSSVTADNLVEIMAKGFANYRSHYKCFTKETIEINSETVGQLLDLWFQHDYNRDDLFDHMIPDDDFDSFVDKVVISLKQNDE